MELEDYGGWMCVCVCVCVWSDRHTLSHSVADRVEWGAANREMISF